MILLILSTCGVKILIKIVMVDYVSPCCDELQKADQKQHYTIKNTVKLQNLNWQLGLQLNYRKITIPIVINVELQTFVVTTLLYYHFL